MISIFACDFLDIRQLLRMAIKWKWFYLPLCQSIIKMTSHMPWIMPILSICFLMKKKIKKMLCSSCIKLHVKMCGGRLLCQLMGTCIAWWYLTIFVCHAHILYSMLKTITMNPINKANGFGDVICVPAIGPNKKKNPSAIQVNHLE